MTPNEFRETINSLSKAGLNLFAATKAENKNAEITELLTQAGIHLEKEESLCLFAHGGKTLWEKLPANTTGQNRIDDYAIEQVKNFFPDARILFPAEESLLPLQRIGRALHLGRPTPLGIDINVHFGLWFAYRCLFTTKIPVPEFLPPAFSSPCEVCSEKPCLTAGGFQEARLSCPYQNSHRYTDEQLLYHQNYLSAWLKSGRNNS